LIASFLSPTRLPPMHCRADGVNGSVAPQDETAEAAGTRSIHSCGCGAFWTSPLPFVFLAC
jgi:hypothetical protein